MNATNSNTEAKAEMFGVVIRNQRIDKQLSQGALGQQVYSGPAYNAQVWLSDVERGVKFPNDEELIRFSETLAVPLDWLENLREVSQKERSKKIAAARKRGSKKSAKTRVRNQIKSLAEMAQAVCKKYNISWEKAELPSSPLEYRERTHYSTTEERLLLAFLARGFSINEIAWALGRKPAAMKNYLYLRLRGKKLWNLEIEGSNKQQTKQLQMNYAEPVSAPSFPGPDGISDAMAKLCPVCQGHGVLATGMTCYVPACGGKGVIL